MFENIHVMTQLLQETCLAAWPVVAVFMFFSFLIVILFGCIIFILEQGTFTVNAEFPQGAYIRMHVNHYDYEVSPFVSIGTAFYWVIVTGATVGYGDLVPTTYAGRALASLTCFFGILGWFDPIPSHPLLPILTPFYYLCYLRTSTLTPYCCLCVPYSRISCRKYRTSISRRSIR